MTPEDKLLKAIFGERAGEVKDASLRVPPGDKGIVIETKVFSRKKKDSSKKSKEKEDMKKLKKKYDDDFSSLEYERSTELYEILEGKEMLRDILCLQKEKGNSIVVLSKEFFMKGWTNYELDGLVTRSVTGEQILLPIWHDVTKREVIDYSPSLADKLARSTATHTVEEIAAEIISVIQNPG